MKMRMILLLLLVMATASAQTTGASAAGTHPISATSLDVPTTLQRIEQTAQAATLDLARLRVEKWKTDGDIKNQAQANADSLSRNLTAALPTLVGGVRSAPRSTVANFKLYRNLNALYDVFEDLAESAGAFGSKQEFETFSYHVQAVDTYRRAFGDHMEALAAAQESELARVRSAGAATPTTRPKKIFVDNGAAAKTSKKK